MASWQISQGEVKRIQMTERGSCDGFWIENERGERVVKLDSHH